MIAFRCLAEKLSRPLSLRMLLTLPFTLQLLGTVGLIGYVSYQNGQQAVNQLAIRLQGEISDQVVKYLDHYLKIPVLINQINVDAFKNNQLSIANSAQLEQHLFQQLQQFKSVAYITISDTQGRFHTANRYPELSQLMPDSNQSGLINYYAVDPQGRKTRLIQSFPLPSIQQRPWYQAAIQAEQTVRVPIFPLADGSDFSMNVSSPIIHPTTRQVQGVISAASDLSFFRQFLIGLNIGQTGRLFIVERDGLLVETSAPQTSFTTIRHSGQTELRRIYANQSDDPLIRLTSQVIEGRFASWRTITGSQQITIPVPGDRLLVQVVPYSDHLGLDWLLVTVIPESDFLAQIHANTQQTILICLGALAGSVVMGIWAASQVTRPIQRLGQAAQVMAHGDLGQPLPSTIPVVELRVLSQAFNHMAQQLRQAFDSLQMAHRSSEEKFATVFRVSPDPIAIMTCAEGEILDVNDHLVAFFGYSRQELIGHQMLSLNLCLTLRDYQQIQQLLKQSGDVHNLEIHLRIKSGAVKPVLLSTETCHLENQACYIVVLTDISDRKQAELQLQQAKDVAEAANHAKSLFLANMSHELRTPLNVILGLTQFMMGQDPELAPEQQENLQVMQRNGIYLLHLINDILDVSKTEVWQPSLQESYCDLSDFLLGLHRMFCEQAEAKGLQLQLNLASDLPPAIRVDQQKLRQVFVNLLGNAIKFTHQGSVALQVAVSNHPPNPTRSETSHERPEMPPMLLRLAVEDTGSGIAPDELRTIFDPFTQAEAGKASLQGTGLGLSISRKLVELMGGELTVHSTPGKGSRFTVEIPVRPLTTGEASALPVRPVMGVAPNQPSYRILVVDDHPDSRDLMVQLLEHVGLEVQAAASGEGAIALWHEWHPHLIWMDMRMPGMDGWETVRRIRQAEQALSRAPDRTKIIALTGHVSSSDQALTLDVGCDDVANKPVSATTIFAKLAEHLGLCYRYDESNGSFAAHSPSDVDFDARSSLPLDWLALQGMPAEWVLSLHYAARACDDEEIYYLLQELPVEFNALQENLYQLAHSYQFEAIVGLTRPLL